MIKLDKDFRKPILEFFDLKVFAFAKNYVEKQDGRKWEFNNGDKKALYLRDKLKCGSNDDAVGRFFTNDVEKDYEGDVRKSFFTDLIVAIKEHNRIVKNKIKDSETRKYFIVDANEIQYLKKANESKEYIKSSLLPEDLDGKVESSIFPSKLWFDFASEKWFNETTIPLNFENTEWYFFERGGAIHDSTNDWGIAIGKLNFILIEEESNKRQKFIKVIKQSKYVNNKEITEFEGWATKDPKDNYLYIDLIKQGIPAHRSNMVLQYSKSNANEQVVFIGHHTYYSTRYNKLLSKTIVMVKESFFTKPSTEHPESFYPEPGFIAVNADKYKKIPTEITRFLYNRQLNRLTMPNTIVDNMAVLHGFLKDFAKVKYDAEIVKTFLGSYFIYYKTKSRGIVEDLLEIKFEEEHDYLYCEYTHFPNSNLSFSYTGKPHFNKDKKCIVLEIENVKENSDDSHDPILLTFALPNPNERNYIECQVFFGTIAGFDDSESIGIAFSCFIVRRDKIDTNFQRREDPAVTKFFNLQGKNFYLKPKTLKKGGFLLSDY